MKGNEFLIKVGEFELQCGDFRRILEVWEGYRSRQTVKRF